MYTSIPVGTKFLVQSSSQANVLTLPRLNYQQVNDHPLHTIQVQSLKWSPPSHTGELHLKISLRHPYMIHVSNSGETLEDLTRKINKAYKKFSPGEEILKYNEEEKVFQVSVLNEALYTNTPLFLRKSYDDENNPLPEAVLPKQHFLTFNAVASDSNTDERPTMRNEVFYAEPVVGEFITPPHPDSYILPRNIMLGFVSQDSESFVIPIAGFNSVHPPNTFELQTIARSLKVGLKQTRHYQLYQFSALVGVNPETNDFVIPSKTYEKFRFISTYKLNNSNPFNYSQHSPAEWQQILGPRSDQMFVPAVHLFFEKFQPPYTLHFENGISETAFLNNCLEKVVALMNIDPKGIAELIFAPRYSLHSITGHQRIGLQIRDSLGTILPGTITLFVTLS